MKSPSLVHRTSLFIKYVVTTALLALGAMLTATAQPTQISETVFNDTFGSSTLNQPNAFPTGTPTASSTSYTGASAKAAPLFSIAPGQLSIYCPSTSSANSEVAALFTTHPVALTYIGDYVELTYTFTDETNQMNNVGGNGSGFFMGIYNANQVPPLGGTILTNGGLSSATTADVGGTAGWLGDSAQMIFSQTAGTAWTVFSRPAQTVADNLNQEVLYNFNNPGGATLAKATPPGPFPFPNLTIGSQYTGQLRITLSAVGILSISNALYTGVGTGGTLIYSNVTASVTGANVLATNFDGLAFGFRATGGGVAWTNNINSITVVASLLTNAGPYFSMTSSGNGCGGAVLGLGGSVTTNTYYLYENGVNTGQSVAGTGSSITFNSGSPITVTGVYTVMASNNATGNLGLMYGSQAIFVGTPSIVSDPPSVTAVTNDPVSFSMSAVGASLAYQWYRNETALTNGAEISGALTTNLLINPAGAADVGSYYCVAQDPCGDILTTAPNAVLTLTPPHNLVWQGGSDGNWDFTEANFTNRSGVAELFSNGDDVTFDDTSSYTGVSVTNSVIATLVTFNSSQAYYLLGAGKITGFSQLADAGSGVLTIGNNNDYTGGTTISNGATLTLGTGSGVNGLVGGIVNIAPTGTLNYSYANSSANNSDNINNGFAGSGMVNVNDATGATVATPLNIVSSNFNGTINVQGYTSLHASNGNFGDPLGFGSTINAPDGTQIWLDQSSLAYTMTFNIGGTGWQGATPQTGALRVYSCTVNGPINLLDNARIGGSINGATIQSVIYGPAYQLEIYGNTNSFVLTLGPTNGSPQNYLSTLITSGAISCANTNAISTGLLTEDAGGDFQLNGHNITVADLNTINNSGNTGYPTWMAGPTVRNNNTTNAAVLTFGGDGQSEEYDGTFLDGSTASLGLTKVGGGTFSVTAVNTNSGPVTVLGGSIALTTGGPSSTSGAFTKTSLIAVGSGASLSDSSTLTLNSGQRLAGQGTVNANVVVSSGAILNPGLPTGTLTVSGSVTMNSGSTYETSLNRANTPNYGKVSASGAITYAGTLFVTNVGAALQAGDTFQLFSGANTSFSGFNLEAHDLANNVNYTWNNNVTTSGQISVATVASRLLALQTAPTPSAITYGQVLSNSIISGGSVTNATGTVVAGTYTFATPTNLPNAGTTNVSVTFTPTDTADYNAFSLSLNVTVNLQTPLLKTAPTTSTITNGSALSASILTGGAVTNTAGAAVGGTFAFTTPSTTPGVGTAPESVTFTSTNVPNNYNPITFNVNVTVVAGASAPTALKFLGIPVVSGTNLTIAVTNTGAGTFYLLGSTNVGSALNGWTPFWTNVAAASGSSTNTVTNAVNPVLNGQFYILSTTNN